MAEPALRPWEALEIPFRTPTQQEVVTSVPRGAPEPVPQLHIGQGASQIARYILDVPGDRKEPSSPTLTFQFYLVS